MFALTRRLTLRPAWPEEADVLAAFPLPPASTIAVAGEALCVIATRDAAPPRTVGATWIAAGEAGLLLSTVIAASERRRGYATEAVHAMLDIARYALGFERLAAVTGDVWTRNWAMGMGFIGVGDDALHIDLRNAQPPKAVVAHLPERAAPTARLARPVSAAA